MMAENTDDEEEEEEEEREERRAKGQSTRYNKSYRREKKDGRREERDKREARRINRGERTGKGEGVRCGWQQWHLQEEGTCGLGWARVAAAFDQPLDGGNSGNATWRDLDAGRKR